MSNDIENILNKIKTFRDERDWMQFHDPKNMAISIILEASELLEHFQWKTKAEAEEYIKKNRVKVEEEIADIALYLFELADNLDIDLLKAMERKIKENARKYPVGKSKGSAKKYREL
jgi:NTP pyrophosphatase (non-canonical NTP hydrolase)